MAGRMIRAAVACSGLGHVNRGIEAWAADLAHGLRAAGTDVHLFGGAPGDGIEALACLRRTGAANRRLTRLCRSLGGWRYGAGSPYDVEQTSFALSLWPRVRRGFDILHVQDPLIARWFELAHRAGLSAARVIYANGTGEGPSVMRRFQNLQLLTQQAHAEWLGQEPAGQRVFMIPNFIDTAVFAPGDRRAARERFGLPQDKTIVLSCAAIRRYHKRVDYLLTEFADVARRFGDDTLLVAAGGREPDTDDVMAQGKALLGDRVVFLCDVPRADMPGLYRAADMFVLSSLHEMFGIVLLEAMASGLPVVCNDTDHFRAIAGPAGVYRDISLPGGMAAGIATLLDPDTRTEHARRARMQAETRFSEKSVITDILTMYRTVLERPET